MGLDDLNMEIELAVDVVYFQRGCSTRAAALEEPSGYVRFDSDTSLRVPSTFCYCPTLENGKDSNSYPPFFPNAMGLSPVFVYLLGNMAPVVSRMLKAVPETQ